jgi:hypothetical protein
VERRTRKEACLGKYRNVSDSRTQLARNYGSDRMFELLYFYRRNLGLRSKARLNRNFIDYPSLSITASSLLLSQN